MPCIAWVVLTVVLVICHEEDELEEGLMAMEMNLKKKKKGRKEPFDATDA